MCDTRERQVRLWAGQSVCEYLHVGAHAFMDTMLPPTPAHPPFCLHLHPAHPPPLPSRSHSAAFPPCALTSQPASSPLPPPSSPTTSLPIHLAISPGHLDTKLDTPPLLPAHPPHKLLAHHHAHPMPTTTGRDGQRHSGKARHGYGHEYVGFGVHT